jgi:hypothetical protein
MNRISTLILMGFAVLCASKAGAQQYPMLDRIANRVIQKYQQSSCEQLYQQRQQPPPQSPMEQNAIQMLHSDPQMQQAFINQVAAPIANKLFQCGLIP